MKKLVSFFEIPTADFGRAVKFYETVLNLELSVMECESEKMAFFPDEDGLAPGAISWAADFLPAKNGVLVHLNVDDMDATLAASSAKRQRSNPKTAAISQCFPIAKEIRWDCILISKHA